MEFDELYSLPLDEFTAERDRLVKRLRGEDRRPEAEAVSRMRKPTTDAWALNQVARRDPKLVEELLATHQEIREASSGEFFRRASETRNRLLDELMRSAAAVLEEADHSAEGPVRDRMTRTLLAAAGDPDTESALQHGTLTRSADIEAQWPGASFPSELGEEDPVGAVDEATRLDEIERLETRAQEMAEQAEALRRAADEARQRSTAAEEKARSAEKAAREARKEADARRRRRR